MIAAHRAGVLLHGFEQRRLRLRGRPVDFVGEQNVGEDRALHERPGAVARGRILFDDVGAGDVGRHQIRRELDAFEQQAEHGGHGSNQQGFCRAGQTRDQAVAADKQADSDLFDDFVLADNDAFYLPDDLGIDFAESR